MTYVYEELQAGEIANRLMRDENAGWTYQGAMTIAEFLIDMAESDDQPIELDIVAIRCEFREGDLEDLLNDYDLESLDELENRTTILHVEGDRYVILEF